MRQIPSTRMRLPNGLAATNCARMRKPEVTRRRFCPVAIWSGGIRLMPLLILAMVGILSLSGQAAERMSLEKLRRVRNDMARQPRRITMNNDGCDVLYFPKEEKMTLDAFLAKRTTPLAGTHVDRITFCSISSGFSNFTHDTKIGTVLSRSGYEFGLLPNTRNIAQEMIDQGTDCLQAVVEFGHRHDMEVFWSFRMNDTHDAAHRPDKPYFLYPPLKQEHPDWLVGEPVKRTPHGRWSSVDYALPQIRDLAFGYIDEVCRNYDVDGVELDFFRHLCYFKSTASGSVASDEQREMMTGLIRRVRTMTEEVGRKRNRPILISVRVPDSVGFCRDMGLAVEEWMSEGLIDILVTTCYFRLNPWEYSVKLGHKHGVQVTPCLSDSRVRGETRFRRSSAESYRGRALNAWNAGADGLHLFNYFNPKAPMWQEIGDREALATMSKLYFVNVRDDDPRRFLANGRDYRTVPVMGPSHPRLITASEPVTLPIEIGDDLPEAQRNGYKPEVKLHLEVPSISRVEQLRVEFNGAELTGGQLSNGWIDYPVPAARVRQGINQVEIEADASALGPDDWSVVYDGENKPSKHWRRDRGSDRAIEELAAGALLIADRGEVSGDYLYYRYPWGAEPDKEAVVEARVKAKAGSSYIIVANGMSGERLGIWPDRIDLYHNSQLQYKMETTDDFHLYRMELKGPDLKVYVDGELRIDAVGAMGPRSGYAKNEVAFGAANSGQMGEAYWEEVKVRASGMTCLDLVVSVSYEKE